MVVSVKEECVSMNGSWAWRQVRVGERKALDRRARVKVRDD